MGGLLKGGAKEGSTENDPGTQGAGKPEGASESTVRESSEAFSPGKGKSQGFQDVEGTM